MDGSAIAGILRLVSLLEMKGRFDFASLVMMSTSATLLQRLRDFNDRSAWNRFATLYEPLIRRWSARQLTQAADVDDLVQQVLTVVLEKLPGIGSFRAWLRSISVFTLRKFWRSRPAAGPDPEPLLQQLEDPHSTLSQVWDRDHDEFVLQRALTLIEPEFTALTWAAFRRVALEQAKPDAVARASPRTSAISSTDKRANSRNLAT
jgi:RNA polymerase sigma-70 factor (ECF subfamily)